MNYQQILGRFKEKKILVIGDIMLDKYIWGDVERISPEAPIQIVRVEKENYVPGGAANVANNIMSLGGNCILIGVVGKDDAKKTLKRELTKRKIQSVLIEDKRPTIQKVRIIAKNQQLLRMDYEDKQYIERHIEKQFVEAIQKFSKLDGIIISDYAKGMITKDLIKEIVNIGSSEGIPIIVDPKPRHIDYYKDVTLITPNRKEASEMTRIDGIEDTDVEAMGEVLLKNLNANVLITRGGKGMSIIEKDKKPHHIPTKAKEVFDVSGAGDTSVAALTLAITSKATLLEAANIANHAGGIVVAKVGTSTATHQELKRSLDDEF